MSNANFTIWLHSLLLFPAVGIAVSGFGWLLFQMATPRRAGWVSAVAVPLTLAGSAAFIAPSLLAELAQRPAAVMLGLLAAVTAGFCFDQGSTLRLTGSGPQCRRSAAPLLLWGMGAFLYIGGAWLDRWSAAFVLTGGAALLGQTCGWIVRLSGLPLGEPGLARRLGAIAAGSLAAAIGWWLLLPNPG
jgi:hypothetical protein